MFYVWTDQTDKKSCLYYVGSEPIVLDEKIITQFYFQELLEPVANTKSN